MVKWLCRVWASMNWVPIQRVVVAPRMPGPYQPLLDCLSIVDDDPRLGL